MIFFNFKILLIFLQSIQKLHCMNTIQCVTVYQNAKLHILYSYKSDVVIQPPNQPMRFEQCDTLWTAAAPRNREHSTLQIKPHNMVYTYQLLYLTEMTKWLVDDTCGDLKRHKPNFASQLHTYHKWESTTQHKALNAKMRNHGTNQTVDWHEIMTQWHTV